MLYIKHDLFKFMKNAKKGGIITVAVLIFSLVLGFTSPSVTYAATSPTLAGSAAYSVLGATIVTNTGATTTVGEVGVSAGTAITGFPPGIAGGNNLIHLHPNDASAIAAQADNLIAFGALNAGANADANCLNPLTGLAGIAPDATDLIGLSLVPGLYCSVGSFLLTNGAGPDLTLTGAGPWVFKTVSALTVSSGASVDVPVPGTDECEVWWRVGSSATIGTGASFVGSILALTDIDLLTGATLVGRAMVQTAAVDLDTNTITGCAVPLVAPNLTLNKIVDGDAADESEWTLTASGPLPLSGPGAAGSTDVVGDVAPGTYILSESSGPSNHEASPWSCVINAGAPVLGSSLALDYGDTATCTITNTYNQPSSSGSRPNPPSTPPSVVAPVVVVPPFVPSLPKTGFPPENNLLNIIVPAGILGVLAAFYLARKKVV